MKKRILGLKAVFAAYLILSLSSMLFSFTARNAADEFLQQLGISKSDADKKITNSILNGSLDTYGIKNIKSLVNGNRSALAKDLLLYTKKYTGSPAFLKAYTEQRNHSKPVPPQIETPEETRQHMVDDYKKSIAGIEKAITGADATLKPTYEKMLVDAKKLLADAQDVNSKGNIGIKKNYEEQLLRSKGEYERNIAAWELQYPAEASRYVKKRLEQFLQETADIDFAAELVTKNGKKIFANPAYESRSKRWKMAFRSGKEVVETSRVFVQQWLQEMH